MKGRTKEQLNEQIDAIQPAVRDLLASLAPEVRPRLVHAFGSADANGKDTGKADWDNSFTDTFHNWSDKNAPDAIYASLGWNPAQRDAEGKR